MCQTRIACYKYGHWAFVNYVTTSCKIVETLSLKNTFSSFQYSPYQEFKPFPLPLPSPPFNVDCLSFQQFFGLLATLIRGEGGCSVRDNRYIDYAPRRWSVSTIFATCCSMFFEHFSTVFLEYLSENFKSFKCHGRCTIHSCWKAVDRQPCYLFGFWLTLTYPAISITPSMFPTRQAFRLSTFPLRLSDQIKQTSNSEKEGPGIRRGARYAYLFSVFSSMTEG